MNDLIGIDEWIKFSPEIQGECKSIICSEGEGHFMLMKDDCIVNPKAVDVESLLDGGQLRHVISDETIDRHGDIVRASGWDLTNYKKNPVILLGHNHRGLPIGKSIRIIKRIKEKQLVSVGEYPSAELHEEANTVFRLAVSGYINSVSVGFMPKEWEPIDEEHPWDGYDIKKQELWEYSIVPVPANPNALINAANEIPGGVGFIRRWAEKILDEMPNEKELKDLDDARKILSGDRVILTPGGSAEILEWESPYTQQSQEGKGGTDDGAFADSVKEFEMSILARVAKTEDAAHRRVSDVVDPIIADVKDDPEGKDATQDDPVVLTLIDEPTIEIDESVITNMVADVVTNVTGRLIDREV